MSALGSTGARVAAYVAALAVVLLAALGLGRLVGPLDAAPAAHEAPAAQEAPAHEGPAREGPAREGPAREDVVHEGVVHEEPAPAAELPGGLQVSQDGYTFDLLDEVAEPGRDRVVRFRVLGPDGTPVTSYDVEHEKRLHLIAIRRDLAGYQHVHPTLAADGTWSARLALRPGTVRLFADFVPTGGPDLTLGSDLHVPGDFTPAARPEPTRVARAAGYDVRLDGDLVAGEPTTLTLHVSRDGEPVTDLQPYLGAYGHLVAIREGDLAYLHVHPEEGPAGPEVDFGTTLPTAGRYRLFLDFRHGDVVRTAELTVETEGSTEARATTHDQGGDSHDH